VEKGKLQTGTMKKLESKQAAAQTVVVFVLIMAILFH
jgi:hypothetical protein